MGFKVGDIVRTIGVDDTEDLARRKQKPRYQFPEWMREDARRLLKTLGDDGRPRTPRPWEKRLLGPTSRQRVGVKFVYSPLKYRVIDVWSHNVTLCPRLRVCDETCDKHHFEQASMNTRLASEAPAPEKRATDGPKEELQGGPARQAEG